MHGTMNIKKNIVWQYIELCADQYSSVVIVLQPILSVLRATSVCIYSIIIFIRLRNFNYSANYRQCYQRSKQFLEPIREGIFPVKAKNPTEHPSVFKIVPLVQTTSHHRLSTDVAVHVCSLYVLPVCGQQRVTI
jgi:hypothetical protein